MFKIQTLNKISAVGLDRLPRDNYEVASEMSAPDGILLRSFKMHEMALPESVLAIARAGAGTNNIPAADYAGRGVVVFNTPGANANGVKELAITAMLIAGRKVVEGINWAKTLEGQGDEVPKLIEGGKANFVGPEIMGKTLGVIGLGAIGIMVANAAVALGMEVIGYDPFLSVDNAMTLSPKVQKAGALESLMKAADYLSIHVPLNDQTKGLINAEKLEMAKDGLRVINLARGGLVNNEDIKGAIASGKVACYVTDFPDEDMIATDGVIALPHIGASTPEAEDNCATMAADQVKEYLENGNIVNSVNFPNTSLARKPGTSRLTVANEDVPNVVGQVTSILADAGLNIEGLVNQSRDGIAYNIIDVAGAITADVVAKVTAIGGVIKVRSL